MIELRDITIGPAYVRINAYDLSRKHRISNQSFAACKNIGLVETRGGQENMARWIGDTQVSEKLVSAVFQQRRVERGKNEYPVKEYKNPLTRNGLSDYSITDLLQELKRRGCEGTITFKI